MTTPSLHRIVGRPLDLVEREPASGELMLSLEYVRSNYPLIQQFRGSGIFRLGFLEYLYLCGTGRH